MPRRSDLGRAAPGPAGECRWSGLALDVEGPRLPALRIEVTAGRRLILRQSDRVVLLARVADDHYGVDVLRTGAYRSPVAPMRADQARNVTGPDSVTYPRWAHRLAGELTATAEGPLHTGRWLLAPGTAGPVVAGDPDGWVDWFGTPGGGVLPLRRLSTADSGRVAAYRKLTRAGVLPPVLLWWVSGLDCHVLLDGHDRLVAAHAEGVDPPVLTLARAVTDDRHLAAAAARHADAAAHLQRQVTAGTPGAADALAGLDRWLAAAHAAAQTAYGPSRAWPVAGGVAAWRRAAAVAPSWAAEVDPT